MQITDLGSLIAFLAVGGIAYKLPAWLENLAWFNGLASNGKMVTVVVLTLIPTFAALGAQQFLVAHPMISEAADPYVRAAIIAINLAITQFKHGSNNAVRLRVAAAVNAGTAWNPSANYSYEPGKYSINFSTDASGNVVVKPNTTTASGSEPQSK